MASIIRKVAGGTESLFWGVFLLLLVAPMYVFGNTHTGGGGSGNTPTGGSGSGNTPTGGSGAGNTQTGNLPGIDNPLKFENLIDFLTAALTIVRNIGFVVAVIMIVYSGFLFVTARGSETKLSDAKRAFVWTLVGLGVLLGAWIFALAIKNTVNAL